MIKKFDALKITILTLITMGIIYPCNLLAKEKHSPRRVQVEKNTNDNQDNQLDIATSSKEMSAESTTTLFFTPVVISASSSTTSTSSVVSIATTTVTSSLGKMIGKSGLAILGINPALFQGDFLETTDHTNLYAAKRLNTTVTRLLLALAASLGLFGFLMMRSPSTVIVRRKLKPYEQQ